ncbi:MAG: RsmB/NOP family class I SAM-dependent RNA methyltransferase [Rhodospirillales bacterium]|nr:RsmB/NOP family class I SAM-dependent RNA methyltransferase [Rhodospirillales bacterium]MCB9997187.1 RsmB/NOP family class I SAM-dependent RNA methyltransferase [Rhodospirillales bacterium]
MQVCDTTPLIMKPASRIKSTIELLTSIQASPVPMDTTIGDYMRARRFIGAKDRTNIAERAYGIMRTHARLGWWLEKTGRADTPRSRVITYLALVELKSGIFDILELFDGTKYGPELLSEDEHKFAKYLADKQIDHPDMPEAVRLECPPEREEVLRALFGDALEKEMLAMLTPAPLDLRVNVRKADRKAVEDALHKDRVHTAPTPYSPLGLRAKDKAFISKTKAFIKGWIDIQDEGSQLIAVTCDVQPGMQVLDYCAGAGGKTLALADMMGGKGRIVAMDLDGRRLEKSKPRLKRAGVSDMIELRPLSDERHKKWLKRQKGTFDVVLADVPCSGSGTWRRNPDMRWRVFGPSLEELLPVQAEILERVAKTVKPGGHLVYATCSLFPAENEEQIEAFLQKHPDFTAVPQQDKPWADGLYMRLSPHRHNTDGFFAAILQRKI